MLVKFFDTAQDHDIAQGHWMEAERKVILPETDFLSFIFNMNFIDVDFCLILSDSERDVSKQKAFST